MTRKPRIYELLAAPLKGPEIESRSFERIDQEAPPHDFDREEWEIVRRMIHTTGDFSIMDSVRFSPGAVAAGIEALATGRPLYVDSNMIRAGLSLARLRAVCARYGPGDIHCYVSDRDVAADAGDLGLPRSLIGARKAQDVFDGGFAVFGNAPTALLELNRQIIEEGVRPAMVIAAPVGFVHVDESKDELASLDVPHIVVAGRRGGSPLAVSIVHALCSLAESRRPRNGVPDASEKNFDLLILLGHGSRVSGADRSMVRVAGELKRTGRYGRVETCNMSRLGPSFEDVFDESVARGVREILLIPYFLNEGLHLKLDIPAKMKAAVARYPEVKLVLGRHLGFDDLLVELVEKRIGESRGLADVREIDLPDEDAYPVPSGQHEYVPMPPEDAAQWRERADEVTADD